MGLCASLFCPLSASATPGFSGIAWPSSSTRKAHASGNVEREATGDQDDDEDVVCPICLDGVHERNSEPRRWTFTSCGHGFCTACLEKHAWHQTGLCDDDIDGASSYKCPMCNRIQRAVSLRPDSGEKKNLLDDNAATTLIAMYLFQLMEGRHMWT